MDQPDSTGVPDSSSNNYPQKRRQVANATYPAHIMLDIGLEIVSERLTGLELLKMKIASFFRC